MKQKYIPINKRSEKKKLRDKIGSLHLKLLKHKRGDKCEFCGKPGLIGRFHILPIARYLRLEFVDTNVILSHWMEKCQTHFRWHHEGANSEKSKSIVKRIEELCGKDYEIKLKIQNKLMPKHGLNYLELFYMALKQEARHLGVEIDV